MIGGRLWIDSWTAATAFRKYTWIGYVGVLSMMSVFVWRFNNVSAFVSCLWLRVNLVLQDFKRRCRRRRRDIRRISASLFLRGNRPCRLRRGVCVAQCGVELLFCFYQIVCEVGTTSGEVVVCMLIGCLSVVVCGGIGSAIIGRSNRCKKRRVDSLGRPTRVLFRPRKRLFI
jgi:hypothetical protein